MSNIEDRLDRIEQKLDALMALSRPAAGGGHTRSAGGVSDSDLDVDIDGPRGDPEVRFVPKRWTGADFKNQKFSACEPEFLDMLAEAYEWFAKKDDETGSVDKNGNPKSKWSRLDAGRARAWSARLRGQGGAAPKTRGNTGAASAGRRTQEPVSNNGYHTPDYGAPQDNDDIPF